MTRLRTHSGRFVALGSLTVVLLACSSSSDKSPPEQSCEGDAGFCVTQGHPETCNQIANDGPNVTPSMTENAAPTAVGGAISEGHWVMTAITGYLPPGATPADASLTGRQALTINGSTSAPHRKRCAGMRAAARVARLKSRTANADGKGQRLRTR
jgi:hypothetical protein